MNTEHPQNKSFINNIQNTDISEEALNQSPIAWSSAAFIYFYFLAISDYTQPIYPLLR